MWADALGIPWPLEEPLVASAITPAAPRVVKHAAAFLTDLVLKLEGIATDDQGPLMRRAFVAGLVLMTHASLRFSE